MKRLANAGLLLITVGLVAVASATVAVPAITGTQAVTIDRNSMQEVLPVGSMAYVQAQPRYHVGDYVTFHQNGNLVTHEIVAELPNPATAAIDGVWFTTKGTHNVVNDDIELNADHIVGKVVASVPLAGLAPKVLATWPLRIFLALTVIGLLALSSAAPKPSRAAPVTERGGGGLELNG